MTTGTDALNALKGPCDAVLEPLCMPAAEGKHAEGTGYRAHARMCGCVCVGVCVRSPVQEQAISLCNTFVGRVK